MKPIQDLIYHPKKNFYWRFVSLALLLFIMFFLIFDINNSWDFLKLWTISLILSGFGYGYAVGVYSYKTDNLKLLKQTIIWLYLKLTGRFTNSVVLNSTIAFSYKTLPLFLIKKEMLSLKDNISNQVTIPYFLLSIFATLCYMVLQDKSDKILLFFQTKIIIIFCLSLLFSFGLFIEQGRAARRLYTIYQIKKFIKENMASNVSSSLYSDEALLNWVKNTVSYAYQLKEQDVPKNILFVTEKEHKVYSYDYYKLISEQGNTLYKVNEGKITRYSPSDPREGLPYNTVTMNTVEQFIKYPGKDTATVSAKYVEEAISTLEKASSIQIAIPILHWQIYWAEHRL